MRGAFALIALLSVFWSCQGYSALKVEQLKSTIDAKKAEEFATPLIVGSPANVARRINNSLQYTQLGLIDGAYKTSPFENQDPETGTTGLGYAVLGQTPQYLSLELRSEYMGAHPSYNNQPVVFDLQSGDRIELADLLTPSGMARFDKRMLRERLAAIDAFVKVPNKRFSEGDQDGHEDAETQRSLYRECRAKMVSGQIRRNEFYLADGKLTALQGCDFPHVVQALDDLMDLPHSETFAALDHDLTPYGHCLLIAHGTQCGLRAASGIHEGLYVGTMAGKLPISLMVFGDGGPFYFYDRYKEHIPLTLSRLGAGHIVLLFSHENQSSEKFDLTVAADGSLSGGWSRGGAEPVPVVLH
ncbi:MULTISPECIES: hypothetical protein [unclassified Pseudomonas]|uniref:hypothetical protein n=1 Tax=unclassified Pseudomonas TaxID=196821 RepID=UPI00128E2F9E|nr:MULTISPECIES: hypothetical protein [unclassified Pseudomonas]MPQ69093.1 hypothetical protein [Pseudomonas sp. MWU12-2323]